jgi:hypothetical protein
LIYEIGNGCAYFAKSREFLNKARDLFDTHHWPDEAGRAAYLAGLHAAQALIFERIGKVIKRHRGVQRELRRGDQREVPLDGPSLPGPLRRDGDGRAAPLGGGALHRAQSRGRGAGG